MNAETKKSAVWINILVLLFVLGLCLVIAEVALRTVWRGYQPMAKSESMMVYNDTLGWVGKPHYDGWLRESGMTVPCRTNQWGFRDELKIAAEDTIGKRRLMFLGDSFIMGTGIAEEVRLSEILEQRDSTIIGYNFGIFGYSTDQELLVLKKYGPLVKPDDVLLFFCANDLVYNDSDFGHRIPKGHFSVDEDGKLTLGNVPVPEMDESKGLIEWFRGRSALAQLSYRTIAQVIYKNKAKRGRSDGGATSIEAGIGEDTNIDSLLLFSTSTEVSDLTYYLLRELRDECARQNTNLILFTTPSNKNWTATRNETPAELQRFIGWCNDLEIEVVDLFPAFYKDFAEQGENLFLPDRMHWNDEGNRVAADVVYDYLSGRKPSD